MAAFLTLAFAALSAIGVIVTAVMAFINRNHIQEIHVVKDKLDTLIRNGNEPHDNPLYPRARRGAC